MSETSTRRIFSIIPDDQSEIRPESFPSLQTISGRNFARNLVRTLRQTDLEDFWKNADWRKFRTQLKEDMPRALLEEIFVKHFSKLRTDGRRKYCPECQTLAIPSDYDDFLEEAQHLGDEGKFFAKWLLLNDMDESLIRPDVEDYERRYLKENETGLTNLVMHTSQWSAQDLRDCLEKQTYLTEINCTFECEADDEQLLVTLAEIGQLTKFAISVVGCPVWTEGYEELLVFLLSQSPTLQDLTVITPLQNQQAEWFWETLTKLPDLRRLECTDGTLMHLSEPKPLLNVEYLKVMVVDVIQEAFVNFPFETALPNLKELDIWYLTGKSRTFDFLSPIFRHRLTRVKGELRAELMPLVWLEALPQMDGSDIFYNNFRELTLTVKRGQRLTSGDTLKLFFRFLPNLEILALNLNEVVNYNEPDFVQHLSENKESFANLKHLKLVVAHHPDEMTGKTVLAIVGNSNVTNFQEIYKFKFSAKDLKELLTIVAEKRLRVVQVFGNNSFTCDNGFHGSFFQYQPEQLADLGQVV